MVEPSGGGRDSPGEWCISSSIPHSVYTCSECGDSACICSANDDSGSSGDVDMNSEFIHERWYSVRFIRSLSDEGVITPAHHSEGTVSLSVPEFKVMVTDVDPSSRMGISISCDAPTAGSELQDMHAYVWNVVGPPPAEKFMFNATFCGFVDGWQYADGHSEAPNAINLSCISTDLLEEEMSGADSGVGGTAGGCASSTSGGTTSESGESASGGGDSSSSDDDSAHRRMAAVPLRRVPRKLNMDEGEIVSVVLSCERSALQEHAREPFPLAFLKLPLSLLQQLKPLEIVVDLNSAEWYLCTLPSGDSLRVPWSLHPRADGMKSQEVVFVNQWWKFVTALNPNDASELYYALCANMARLWWASAKQHTSTRWDVVLNEHNVGAPGVPTCLHRVFYGAFSFAGGVKRGIHTPEYENKIHINNIKVFLSSFEWINMLLLFLMHDAGTHINMGSGDFMHVCLLLERGPSPWDTEDDNLFVQLMSYPPHAFDCALPDQPAFPNMFRLPSKVDYLLSESMIDLHRPAPYTSAFPERAYPSHTTYCDVVDTGGEVLNVPVMLAVRRGPVCACCGALLPPSEVWSGWMDACCTVCIHNAKLDGLPPTVLAAAHAGLIITEHVMGLLSVLNDYNFHNGAAEAFFHFVAGLNDGHELVERVVVVRKAPMPIKISIRESHPVDMDSDFEDVLWMDDGNQSVGRVYGEEWRYYYLKSPYEMPHRRGVPTASTNALHLLERLWDDADRTLRASILTKFIEPETWVPGMNEEERLCVDGHTLAAALWNSWATRLEEGNRCALFIEGVENEMEVELPADVTRCAMCNHAESFPDSPCIPIADLDVCDCEGSLCLGCVEDAVKVWDRVLPARYNPSDVGRRPALYHPLHIIDKDRPNVVANGYETDRAARSPAENAHVIFKSFIARALLLRDVTLSGDFVDPVDVQRQTRVCRACRSNNEVIEVTLLIHPTMGDVGVVHVSACCKAGVRPGGYIVCTHCRKHTSVLFGADGEPERGTGNDKGRVLSQCCGEMIRCPIIRDALRLYRADTTLTCPSCKKCTPLLPLGELQGTDEDRDARPAAGGEMGASERSAVCDCVINCKCPRPGDPQKTPCPNVLCLTCGVPWCRTPGHESYPDVCFEVGCLYVHREMPVKMERGKWEIDWDKPEPTCSTVMCRTPGCTDEAAPGDPETLKRYIGICEDHLACRECGVFVNTPDAVAQHEAGSCGHRVYGKAPAIVGGRPCMTRGIQSGCMTCLSLVPYWCTVDGHDNKVKECIVCSQCHKQCQLQILPPGASISDCCGAEPRPPLWCQRHTLTRFNNPRCRCSLVTPRYDSDGNKVDYVDLCKVCSVLQSSVDCCPGNEKMHTGTAPTESWYNLFGRPNMCVGVVPDGPIICGCKCVLKCENRDAKICVRCEARFVGREPPVRSTLYPLNTTECQKCCAAGQLKVVCDNVLCNLHGWIPTRALSSLYNADVVVWNAALPSVLLWWLWKKFTDAKPALFSLERPECRRAFYRCREVIRTCMRNPLVQMCIGLEEGKDRWLMSWYSMIDVVGPSCLRHDRRAAEELREVSALIIAAAVEEKVCVSTDVSILLDESTYPLHRPWALTPNINAVGTFEEVCIYTIGAVCTADGRLEAQPTHGWTSRHNSLLKIMAESLGGTPSLGNIDERDAIIRRLLPYSHLRKASVEWAEKRIKTIGKRIRESDRWGLKDKNAFGKWKEGRVASHMLNVNFEEQEKLRDFTELERREQLRAATPLSPLIDQSLATANFHDNAKVKPGMSKGIADLWLHPEAAYVIETEFMKMVDRFPQLGAHAIWDSFYYALRAYRWACDDPTDYQSYWFAPHRLMQVYWKSVETIAMATIDGLPIKLKPSQRLTGQPGYPTKFEPGEEPPRGLQVRNDEISGIIQRNIDARLALKKTLRHVKTKLQAANSLYESVTKGLDEADPAITIAAAVRQETENEMEDVVVAAWTKFVDKEETVMVEGSSGTDGVCIVCDSHVHRAEDGTYEMFPSVYAPCPAHHGPFHVGCFRNIVEKEQGSRYERAPGSAINVESSTSIPISIYRHVTTCPFCRHVLLDVTGLEFRAAIAERNNFVEMLRPAVMSDVEMDEGEGAAADAEQRAPKRDAEEGDAPRRTRRRKGLEETGASALLSYAYANAVLKKSERMFAGVRRKQREPAKTQSPLQSAYELLRNGVEVFVRRIIVESTAVIQPGTELLVDEYGWDDPIALIRESQPVPLPGQKATDEHAINDDIFMFTAIYPTERGEGAAGEEAILRNPQAGYGLKLSGHMVGEKRLLMEYSGSVWTKDALFGPMGVTTAIDTLKKECATDGQCDMCTKDACARFRNKAVCETCAKVEVLSFFQTYAMEVKSWDDTDLDYIVNPAIRDSDAGKMLVGKDSTARNVAEWHIFPQLFHTTDLLGQGHSGRAPLINEARFICTCTTCKTVCKPVPGSKPKRSDCCGDPVECAPHPEDVLMNGQPAMPNVRYRLWSKSDDISHYRRVTLHHTLLKEVEERMRGGGGGGVRGGGIQKST